MPIAHLNGIDINYEVHGEGTPFILTHGYTSSLDAWREQANAPPPLYPAGSWGPEQADDLIARDGRRWRKP